MVEIFFSPLYFTRVKFQLVKPYTSYFKVKTFTQVSKNNLPLYDVKPFW